MKKPERRQNEKQIEERSCLRTRTKTIRSSGDPARPEACLKPIKLYLPGPKTITFGAGATPGVFRSRSLSIYVARSPFVSRGSREIGRGPLIFAAKVLPDPIQLCMSAVIMGLIRWPDTLGENVETSCAPDPRRLDIFVRVINYLWSYSSTLATFRSRWSEGKYAVCTALSRYRVRVSQYLALFRKFRRFANEQGTLRSFLCRDSDIPWMWNCFLDFSVF